MYVFVCVGGEEGRTELSVCVFACVGGEEGGREERIGENGFWVWSPCSHNRNIAVQQS